MTEDNTTLALLKERLRLSFYAFIGVLVAGTAGYMALVPSATVIDSLYMTVITVTTVGYGEVVDLTGHPGGRLFTITLIFAGMGIILYFVSNVTAFLIDGSLKEIFARKRMRKMIEQMSNHYIVCGLGTMGVHVVEELVSTGRPCVVIEQRQGADEELRKVHPEVCLIVGDASENDNLLEAGIERARGIIIAADNDKDNMVMAISARQLNPAIRIVVRCSETKHAKKLKLAGADAVISSNYIGGLRMVSEMVRPSVVTFLDTMLRDRQKKFRIEESRVSADSEMAGKPISSIKGRALVLAVVPPGSGEYIFNPSDDYKIEPGSTVVFMGSPEDKAAIDRICAR